MIHKTISRIVICAVSKAMNKIRNNRKIKILRLDKFSLTGINPPKATKQQNSAGIKYRPCTPVMTKPFCFGFASQSASKAPAKIDIATGKIGKLNEFNKKSRPAKAPGGGFSPIDSLCNFNFIN
jgi:hypothetical protein